VAIIVLDTDVTLNRRDVADFAERDGLMLLDG